MNTLFHKRVGGIVLLLSVLFVGSVAGGFLFQAVLGGHKVVAQDSGPVLDNPPPSLSALVHEVNGNVVAIGTKSQIRTSLGNGSPFGQRGTPFNEYRMERDEDGNMVLKTPKGTFKLHQDEDGSWWYEDENGERHEGKPESFDNFGGFGEGGPGFGMPFGGDLFERFFGEGSPFGEGFGAFKFDRDDEGNMTITTPKGTFKLSQDENGAWWYEDENGEKKEWNGQGFGPMWFFRQNQAEGGEAIPQPYFDMEKLAADIPQTVGSGVVISPDGYIVTNSHVASALPKDDIWVVFDEDDFVQAQLVGMDEETDVAVLKVDRGEALPFSQLGDSDALEVGDWVMAVGQPFGLQRTFTVGILSARARSLGKTYDDFLQTDAAIHPGNSGGPLYNMDGEIVGINTAIATNSPLQPMGQGIGFSIPSNVVKRISEALIRDGEIVRGYIGVGLAKGVVEAKERKTDHGALVISVEPNGPSASAGLQVGDVIVTFNGEAVQNGDHLVTLAAATKPGDAVSVEYVRNGETLETTLHAARRPSVAEMYAPGR